MNGQIIIGSYKPEGKSSPQLSVNYRGDMIGFFDDNRGVIENAIKAADFEKNSDYMTMSAIGTMITYNEPANSSSENKMKSVLVKVVSDLLIDPLIKIK